MQRTKKPPADYATWGFSEHAPWVLSEGSISWLTGVGVLRARTRAEIPGLLERRRVPPLARMVTVVAVLGRALALWWLFDRRRGQSHSRSSLSRRLRFAFNRLGPTYIKLGQILSSGQGLFPDEVVDQFRLLRDQVPAETFHDVRETVERDLGRPLDDVFSLFAPEPVAAASIAQVHAATLRSGEEVVVKVQRPQVGALVRKDLAVMSWLAPWLVGRIPIAALANPPALVELFADTIVEELDFRLEGGNMLDVAAVLAKTDQRAIVVPRPHPALVTRRVLVMERLSGFVWDDVEGMLAAGVDTAAVLRSGIVAFFEGALLFGVFHGDLHGGNLFVQPDGKVALLDFGITGRLGEQERLAFLRLLLGATANQVREQIEALRDLGALPMDVDIDGVIRDLDLDQPVVDPTTLTSEEILAELQKVAKALMGYGAKMPKELMLFVKNMLFMDSAVANLAPDIDLLAEIVTLSAYFADRHGDRIVADIGVDPRALPVDLDGIRASWGLTPEVQSVSYRDLQARRDLIRKRFDEDRKRGFRLRLRSG